MQEELEEFVRVVQQNFSDPVAVLLPESAQQFLRDML